MKATVIGVMAALLALLMAPSSALAQCEGVYTNNKFAEDIVAVGEMLDNADLPGAKRKLRDMGLGTTCLDKLVETGLMARFGQLMAMSFFFDQDEAQAERWALVARYTDPKLAYDFDEGHPFLDLIAALKDPPFGTVEGMRLAPPLKGAIVMNGFLAIEPVARAEVPYLVQVFDGEGALLGGYWQDGSAFQAALLTDGTGKAAKPRWFRGPIMSYTGEVVSSRGNSNVGAPTRGGGGGGSKLVPALIASSLAATSAATLAVAGLSKSSLPNQTTSEGLTQARTTANAMVLVSGVTFAGALGVGATVFIDGSAVGLSFRF